MLSFVINIMHYNKLSPTVKFPYEMVRGSIAQRQNKSIQYVEKLYQSLYPKFKRGEISIDDVRKSVREVLQNRGGVKVIKTYDPEYDGLSDIIFSPHSDNITKTTLEISSKNGKINFSALVTIMHEFQHIMDQIFHPKYLILNQTMTQKGLYTDKFNRIYDNLLYKRLGSIPNKSDKKQVLRTIRYKLLNFLRGYSVQDKIGILQDFRYGLMMEEQAYRTQLKYAKRLHKKHIPIHSYDLSDENLFYMFKEKIDLIKQLAFDIIKVTRKKHECKLRQQKIKKCKKNQKN